MPVFSFSGFIKLFKDACGSLDVAAAAARAEQVQGSDRKSVKDLLDTSLFAREQLRKFIKRIEKGTKKLPSSARTVTFL
jgi:hypothetical protein